MSPSSLPSADGPPALASLLADARQRAALTQRELAEAMQVSRATVAEAELGSDIRHSTAQRYVDILASLSPDLLLGQGTWATPVSSPAVWRCCRQLIGFEIRKLVRTLVAGTTEDAQLTLEVLGVRSLHGRMAEPQVRHALLRAVYRGDPNALRAALDSGGDEAGGELSFADSQFEHEFTFPAKLDRQGFSYRRKERPAEFSSSFTGVLSFTPGFPIKELELAIVFPTGELPHGLRYEAHATGASADRTEDLAPALRPAGLASQRQANQRRLSLKIPLPETYVEHQVHWSIEDDAAVGDGVKTGQGLPTVLKRGRESRGLSQRGLATQMNVAPMTVGNCEKGKDPRLSTLQAYRTVFDDLRASSLIEGGGPERTATVREVWQHYRNIYGIEAAEESKELVIAGDGSAVATYGTRGLKSLAPRDDELVVRYGSSPRSAAGKAAPPDIIEQDGDEDEQDDGFRTRFIRRPNGQVIHQLSFSAEAARRGVSYTRRVAGLGKYPLSQQQARDTGGLQGSAEEGHGFTAAMPARRLRISACFPRKFWPTVVRARASAFFDVPRPEGEDLLDVLHGDAHELCLDKARGCVTLTVEEPLIGINYALSWLLP